MSTKVTVAAHVTATGTTQTRAKLDRVTTSTNKTADAVKKLEQRMRLIRRVAALATAAFALLGGAIAALTLTVAIANFARFEQGMKNVQAVSRASAEDLKRLEETALRAAAATKFDTKQATDGLYALASAGFTVEEQMKSLIPVLNLAAATAGDLGTASEQIVMALRGFQLGADQAERAADVLTAATQVSALNSERLTGALQNSAAVSNAFGQTLEGTVAALAVLTTALSDGSVAGTSLAGSWIQMTRQAKKLGIEIKNLETGAMLPLVEILYNFEQAGINAQDAMDAFGARGGKAMSILLAAGSDALAIIEGQITSAGQAAEVAAIQMDTLKGTFLIMKSALDVLLVELGRTGATGARSFFGSIAEDARRATVFIKQNADEIRETLTAAFGIATKGMRIATGAAIRFARALDDITVAALAFTGALVIGKYMALVQVSGLFVTNMRMVLAVSKKAGIALQFLGGTVGLVAAAFAALAWGVWKTHEAVQEHEKTLVKARVSYKRAEEVIKKAKKATLEYAEAVDKASAANDKAAISALRARRHEQLLRQQREIEAKIIDTTARMQDLQRSQEELTQAPGGRRSPAGYWAEMNGLIREQEQEIPILRAELEKLKEQRRLNEIAGYAVAAELEEEMVIIQGAIDRIEAATEGWEASEAAQKRYAEALSGLHEDLGVLEFQRDLLDDTAISMRELAIQTDIYNMAREAGVSIEDPGIIEKVRRRYELEKLNTEEIASRTRIEAMERQKVLMQEMVRAIEKGDLTITGANWEKIVALIKSGVDPLSEYGKKILAAEEATNSWGDSLDAVIKGKLIEQLKVLQQGFLALAAAMEAMGQTDLSAMFRTAAEGVQEVIDDIEETEKAIETSTKAGLNKAEESWKSFSRSIQTHFSDSLAGLFKGEEDAFENFFDNIFDMFIKMIADMIAYALVNKIFVQIEAQQSSSGTGGLSSGGGFMDSIMGLFGGGGGQGQAIGTNADGSTMYASGASGGGGIGSMFGGTMGSGAGGGSAFGGMGSMAGGMGIMGGIMGGLGAGQAVANDSKYDWGKVGNYVGTAAGTAIGAYFGGPLGAQIGGTLGGLIGQKIGDAIKKTVPEAWADVKLEDGKITAEFARGKGPVGDIAEHFDAYLETFADVTNAFVGSLGGVFTALEEGIELKMTEDKYRVIVDGVVTGFGQDLEAAIKFAMQETFKKATIEDTTGALIDALGELDQFFLDAELLGIDMLEVIQKGAFGILEAREQILAKKEGLLTTLVDAMERAGLDANVLAADRAKIEQQIFLVSLKKLELELTAFGMMTAAIQGILNSLGAWAADVSNFMPDVNVGKVGGGKKGGTSKKDKRADLIRWLQGFELDDFTLALVDLNKEFTEAAKKAKKLGVAEERVTRARAKAVLELASDLFQPIWDLQEEMRLGDKSILSPGAQFVETQTKFEELRAAALAGDAEAIAELPDAAKAYLDMAASFFGTSSAAYRAIFLQIEQTLGTIAPTESDLTAIMEQASIDQLKALHDIEDILRLIGDALGASGLQHGGSVESGVGHIVGEAGPEWFQPTNDGVILPFVPKTRTETRSGSGSREITAAVQESTQILVREMKESREEAATSAEDLSEMRKATDDLSRVMKRFLNDQERKRSTG